MHYLQKMQDETAELAFCMLSELVRRSKRKVYPIFHKDYPSHGGNEPIKIASHTHPQYQLNIKSFRRHLALH
jgi:hypothetical protein